MISRSDVMELYRLILDRQPESDDVVAEKRRAKSISAAAFEMLTSEEFLGNNEAIIVRTLDLER